MSRRLRSTRAAIEYVLSPVMQGLLRWIIMVADVAIGASWILGPDSKHSSPIYSVWNELGVPWEWTGLFVVVAGLLLLTPAPWPRAIGYAMGIVFRVTFAGYALGAYFSSPIVGLTGFADWATLAVLNAVCLLALFKVPSEPDQADVLAAIRRVDA